MRDDDPSTELLTAVRRLSGRRRAWVRADRVLAATSPGPRPVYWAALADPRWRERPELASYLVLAALVRSGAVEGLGNFGTDADPPTEPVFTRCRPLPGGGSTPSRSPR